MQGRLRQAGVGRYGKLSITAIKSQSGATRPLGKVFASYDVEERALLAALGKGAAETELLNAGPDVSKR
jgi:hypothetical protein